MPENENGHGKPAEHEASLVLEIPLDVSDILCEGSAPDVGYESDDELLDAYTESYEDILREMLPHLELAFRWDRNVLGGRGRTHCGCGEQHMGSPCVHESDVNGAAEYAHLKALERMLEPEEQENHET